MKHFRLSCRGRVATVLTLSLVCAPRVWADGIVPAPGSGASVQIAPSGASVVQIAPPSAAGLSHNRFNDYNVGMPGAVLNNAVQAGTSQLAGLLQANAGLGGRAAAVILNEVVSRNPSLLLGRQEIFGRAADFVLANPNGITCNGCGFINTPRASLLVGTPQLEAGRLKSLSSVGADGALRIGDGGIAGADVLHLIAPRIDAQGQVVATSGIMAVSGRNTVDYGSRNVTPEGGTRGEALDSAYLGGMQAGRISIVSTEDGAGVNLSGLLTAEQRIKVMSRGAVELDAAALKSDKLVLAAAADIALRPRIETTTQEQERHGESWFIWKTGAHDVTERHTTSRVTRSRLEGRQVTLNAGGNIGLSAAEIAAGDVVVAAGGAIRVDGAASLERKSEQNDAWKNSWYHRQYREQSHLAQEVSRLESSGNLRLSAARDIDLVGAQLVAAQDMRIQAGGKVQLAGLTEQDAQVDSGDRYLDGPGLESGSWNRVTTQERLRGAALEAGRNVQIGANDGQLSILGSRVQAGGNAVLQSGTSVHISAQTTDRQDLNVAQSTQWGGIAGSERKNDSERSAVNVPAEILAQGALSVRADQDIRIAGSQVKGVQGASAETRRGEVHIEHVTDLTQSHVDERRGGAFDIQTGRRLGDGEHEALKGALVASATNLQLHSAGDLSVTGSEVDAGGELDLHAGGNVRIVAAEERHASSQQEMRLEWATSAGADARQAGVYRAEAGVVDRRQSKSAQQGRHTGGEIGAATVHVEAEGQVSLQGGKVVARAGGVVLRGNGLDLGAVNDVTQTREDTSRDGIGVYAAGGLDEGKVGLWQRSSATSDRSDSVTPVGSRVTASQDISLDARQGTLRSQGAHIEAGGTLSAAGGQIDNQAVSASSSREQRESTLHGELGVGVELGGLLKPLQGVADKLQGGDVIGAWTDAGKIKDGVAAGIEHLRQGDWTGALALAREVGTPSAVVQVSHEGQIKSAQQASQQANGSHFSAATVNVHSDGALNDRATHYEAKAGSVDLKAENQRFESAQNGSSAQSSQLDWNVAFKASTVTGDDLALNVALSGRHAGQQDSTRSVQGGAVIGSGGVHSEISGDASLQAVRVDGGSGRVEMRADGDLRLSAAQSSASAQEGHTGAALEFDLKLQPGGENVMRQGGRGKLDWDVARQRSAQTDWQGAQINAQSGVHLQAGGDLSVQAAQLGSAEAQGQPAKVDLRAGGAITLDAAQSERTQSQWGTSGNVALSAQIDDKPGGGFNIKGDSGSSAQTTQRSATVDGVHVVLDSGGATRLQGAQVAGERVDARIGAELTVASVPDRERSTHRGLELGASMPDLSAKPNGRDEMLRVRGEVVREAQDGAAQQSGLLGRERLQVEVSGPTTLDGGRLQSGSAAADTTGGGTVTAHELPGRYEMERYGVDVGGAPLDVLNAGVQAVMSGTLPFGLKRDVRREYRPLPSVGTARR